MNMEVMNYKSRDGQELMLSFDSVKKYLVSGDNRDFVTEQELVYFMSICKAKGLNPFKKDCYLIKYSQKDPAAIVVSIDYFRARARAMKDCNGWKKGIIVQGKDGKIHDSYGLILEGEKLLGGFFEATPEGWNEPFRLEVNLNGYVKKTSEGKLTKFWAEHNQPSQIAKVAESQGLRTLWPDEFQGLYTDLDIKDNIQDQSPIDIYPESETGNPQDDPENLSFDDYILKHYPKTDAKTLDDFLKECAKLGAMPVDKVKENALGKIQSFMAAFERFKIKSKEEKPKRGRKPKDEKPNAEPKPDAEKTIHDKLLDDIQNMPEVFKAKQKELGFQDELIIKEIPLELANMLHQAIAAEIDKY